MFEKKTWFGILSLTMLLGLAVTARAEQYVDFGDYVVHYNALSTTFLSAETAREYNIKRSRNRALLNIVVQKKKPDGTTTPVEAAVSATATNLTGQLRTIQLRPVHDGAAIYYIGVVNVADGETLDFTVNIQPEGVSRPFVIRFRKEFYTR